MFLPSSILSAGTDLVACVTFVSWKELNKCFVYFFLSSLLFNRGRFVPSLVSLIEEDSSLHIVKHLSTRGNKVSAESVLE